VGDAGLLAEPRRDGHRPLAAAHQHPGVISSTRARELAGSPFEITAPKLLKSNGAR